MVPVRALPRLAVRRMRRNWRLLSSVVTGTLAAAAILSTTAIYADAIRDLGLAHAVAAEDPRELDIRTTQTNTPVNEAAYTSTRDAQAEAVRNASRDVASLSAMQGMSATFYVDAISDQPTATGSLRPRANLIFRDGLPGEIELIEGTFPPAAAASAGGPIQVLIGSGTAEEHGISVGDTLEILPFWLTDPEPIAIQVVGVGRELDPESRYWGAIDERLDARERSWSTFRLWIPAETFFGQFRSAIPTVTAEYTAVHTFDFERIDARNAIEIAGGMSTLESSLTLVGPRITYQSQIEALLRTYDEKLFFTQIPLLVLLLQIGAIVAYYLVMVSTMLIERQAAEIATMRSRGATTAQLLGIYGVEGTILAAVAALVGPVIAGGVISLLGPTPAFRGLSGGGFLDVHVGMNAYALAGVGALIAFASLMIPAWRATRNSVVEFKRGAARPGQTPLFMRYYLDVVFVVAVAVLFWRLSQQEGLFTETLLGETQFDPLLLATPAVFMVTVGVVFLRLFPIALHLIEWLVGWTRSVAILVGMRSLVRQPSHYARLILLLMFATGVGMFGATFSATLAQSYIDRAEYTAGADLRVEFTSDRLGGGDAAVRAVFDTIPADAVSLATRTEGTIYIDRATNERFSLLAVDSDTFAEVGLMRHDFASEPLDEMMATLGASSVEAVSGPLLPAGTAQVGIWARFPDIRGRMEVRVLLRDASGFVFRRPIASVIPSQSEGEQWQFYVVGVDPPRTGALASRPPVEEPFEVVGIFLAGGGPIAQQRGVVHLGPLMASAMPAPEASGLVESRTLERPWPDATQVTDLGESQWGVIQTTRLGGVDDVLRPVDDPIPGGLDAMRYEWQDTQAGSGARGIGLRVEAEPLPMYLTRDSANALGLREGDDVTFSAANRFLPGRVAGLLDYFPTWNAHGSLGFALVDSAHLIALANASTPDRPLTLNEAWIATDDPDAAIAALEGTGISRVIDRAAIQAEQQEDPLIAAGWSGILAIAFGSVLLLSAIGFVVYSYLTAQQRGLEFAILRTLGFSRPQIFVVVAFEQLFVIVTGMGLGTLVGLQIGEIMMGFLATDETGVEVTPPFILGVSWPQVFIVWAILGAVFIGTIAGVVAMYFRLAVHRVLRIGDA